MNDETTAGLMKRTREWLQSCVNAATRSGVPEEADLEAFILAHIDGEPARLAAAREEMREACALDAEERVGCASTYDEIRSVPLDATPLADELRTLRAKYDELHTAAGNWLRQRDLAFDREEEVRARVAELEARLGEWAEKDGNSPGYNLEKAKTYGRIAHEERRRAETAEAALAEAHERLDEFGMRRDGTTATPVEGIAAMRTRIDEYRAEWYRAEAQVAAARAVCERLIDRPWSRWAGDAGRDVLRAMDEATKK